jgi:hypothetical protein
MNTDFFLIPRSLCNPWLKGAASGSPLAAGFIQPLKIVVQHSSMTNQTHLFGQFDGGGSN